MSCVELTLLAKNPDNNEDGEAKFFIDIDDIMTAYRFPWQNFTMLMLRHGGQVQVTELPEEILCHKDW